MTHLNFNLLKKGALPLFCLLILFTAACKKKKPAETTYDVTQAHNLTNISYGSDNYQKMDIYLPANRNSSTKVFVLIHGGGWGAGDKADFTEMLNSLKVYYPNHAIININYRLATQASPAFPKQIDDIQLALNEISLPKYSVSSNFFLFGASAGGHLSLLYAYGYDPNHHVKGICNTVGPADFTDPNYLNNPIFAPSYGILISGGTQNSSLIQAVSPALRVTASAPPTLSFYGELDPLVPATQMDRLHNALDSLGVYNEKTMYQGAGHGDWNPTQANDYVAKMVLFVNAYFP
ncbi:alpha/beta hydrolase [Fluviicola taffensis]|uniref:Putative lipase n=1 Tax=Fluviicola taffensis (strain DSM 16823 / NCIMB 13979 / RW262) TaxID=755732 RepID=F2IE92_FLUTR|nr:alpha/beta hydrolase [Fluviicola taffensis]AEA42410.1 putative lipase [Fluviicola taffensis DSM 16823]